MGPEARRVSAAERRRKRQKRMMVFYVVLFLMVLGGGVILSLTVLFKIDAVEVSGASRYTEAQILQLSGIEKGQNLFLTDEKTAQATITTKLPYIGTVNVERVLPSKIILRVEEAKESGVVEQGGKFVILSDAGKILALADKAPENCAVIKGLALDAPAPGQTIKYKDETSKKIFAELSAVLATHKMEKITEIDLSDLYKLKIVYDKRITMNLGLPTDLDLKLRMAKESILDAGKLDENSRGELNLSTVSKNNAKAYFSQDYGASTSQAQSELPTSSTGESASTGASAASSGAASSN